MQPSFEQLLSDAGRQGFRRPPEHFTVREMQVVRLLCRGYSTKAIAARLGVSFKTAATHRYTVFGKAGVANAVMLLRWALKCGVVSLDEAVDPAFSTSIVPSGLA